VIEFTTELFLICLSMALSFGVSVLVIVLPYMERKSEAKAAEAERRDRERLKQQLLYTALDYDFARDLTAGKETTQYNDLIRIIKSGRGAEAAGTAAAAGAASGKS